jgi:hypothetical protein
VSFAIARASWTNFVVLVERENVSGNPRRFVFDRSRGAKRSALFAQTKRLQYLPRLGGGPGAHRASTVEKRDLKADGSRLTLLNAVCDDFKASLWGFKRLLRAGGHTPLRRAARESQRASVHHLRGQLAF